jgi:beta-lactamase superfamily II metal-dependent hydrolase
MLNDLTPKTAIISTGKNNYGHPRNSTLELLKNSKTKMLRTDYNKAIKVSIDKNKIKIYTYKTNLKECDSAFPFFLKQRSLKIRKLKWRK